MSPSTTQNTPCHNCITFAICRLKPKITCPILSNYVLEFGIKGDEDEKTDFVMIEMREFGWTVVWENLKETLKLFKGDYTVDYSMGSATIFPNAFSGETDG